MHNVNTQLLTIFIKGIFIQIALINFKIIKILRLFKFQ